MKTYIKILHTQTPFLHVATKCVLEGDCVTVGGGVRSGYRDDTSPYVMSLNV
jgi:hypothetical protein